MTTQISRTDSQPRFLADPRFLGGSIAVMLALTLLVAVTAPAEQTLGGPNARLVYFHGALVWASIITWFIAAGAGVAAFVRADSRLHRISQTLGWVALLWWVLYIPVSILAANATWANNSWNLTFLLEPRFAMAFQMVAVMLVAVGLPFFFRAVSVASIANILVVLAMLFLMQITERVLHPPAPIRDTESLRIQLAFAAMTILLLLTGFQTVRWWHIRRAAA